MKRWIIGLVTLFVAGMAQAVCPTLYGFEDDCEYGSTCREAVQECEEEEQDRREAESKLRTLRTRVRKCLRSGDLDSMHCTRMTRPL
jgi:hypothetical protein